MFGCAIYKKPMNIYLIILLLVVIVVFSNLAMFGLVRGSRSMKFDWFSKSKDDMLNPFEQEGSQLSELRQRIEDLSDTEEKPESTE